MVHPRGQDDSRRVHHWNPRESSFGRREADLFAAIGASGTVYPAAGFVSEAAAAGGHTVEINLERSEIAGLFAEVILGPAPQTVPA